MTGNQWPGWTTTEKIGQGSFGSVYKIERELFGNKEYAALKVISIPQSPSEIDELKDDGYDEDSITETINGYVNSIIKEYSTMRKLSGNTNIVNCDEINVIQHENDIGYDIYIKMELLKPLTKLLDNNIPVETVIKLGIDICNALVLCKKISIIHRDIKPENIFVSPYGDYKLGDFGIAKTVEKTTGGTKIGTYKYMAPEVYNNQPYGTSSDIYSLGLVMYWMLNERRMPFMPLPPEKIKAGANEEARLRRLSGERINPPAHGDRRLKEIVLKACEYSREDRYKNPEDMLEDLLSLSNGEMTEKTVKEEKSGSVEVSREINATGEKNSNEIERESKQEPDSSIQAFAVTHSDEISKKNIFKIGSVVRFGKNNLGENPDYEPLEWIVIDIDKNKALVLLEKAIQVLPFAGSEIDSTWEYSRVRQVLNTTFHNTCFDLREQDAIIMADVTADANVFHMDLASMNKDTKDKVFLLSLAEVFFYRMHFSGYTKDELDEIRKCKAPSYLSKYKEYVEWWTRTPGEKRDTTCVVQIDGKVNPDGVINNSNNIAIRPAIWIDIDKYNCSSDNNISVNENKTNESKTIKDVFADNSNKTVSIF